MLRMRMSDRGGAKFFRWPWPEATLSAPLKVRSGGGLGGEVCVPFDLYWGRPGAGVDPGNDIEKEGGESDRGRLPPLCNCVHGGNHGDG